ncbi:MAG TPA: hypothetical protein VMU83_15515, partial [Hanamia sp.]|nr:hypothetical protein [Hanamia sp.]
MGKTTTTINQQFYNSFLEFLYSNHPITQDTHPFMVTGWVIVFGTVLFLVSPLLYILVLRLINKYQSVYLYEIRLPKATQNQLAIEEIGSIFASLHNLIYSPFNPIYKVFFEIIKTSGYIKIYVGSNDPRILDEAKKTLNQLQNIEFNEVKTDPIATFPTLFAKQVSSTKSFYPLKKDPLFFDHILSYLNSLTDKEYAGVQFILQGVHKSYQINKSINKAIARDVRHYGKETSEGRNEVEIYKQKDIG